MTGVERGHVPAGGGGLISIGEAAEMLGTTTRTLRYYEELGLVSSSRQTLTAQRRYGPEDVERLVQIRKLQTLLGLDLDEIAEHLAASDRLDGIRAEFRSSPPPERQEAILVEGLTILDRLLDKVREHEEGLAQFRAELDGRISKCRSLLAELGVEVASVG